MRSQTEVAVLKRINHKLETDSPSGSVVKVRKSRGQKQVQELGEFYTVEVYHNVLREKDVDIKALAKELGV